MKSHKEWIKRAIRTFVQTVIGYVAVAVPNIDFNDTSVLKATIIGIGTSALAAGIAALMNADWNHIE